MGPAILPIVFIVILLVILFNFAGAFLKQATEATRAHYRIQFQLLKMRFSIFLIFALMFIGAVVYAGFKFNLKIPSFNNQGMTMYVVTPKMEAEPDEIDPTIETMDKPLRLEPAEKQPALDDDTKQTTEEGHEEQSPAELEVFRTESGLFTVIEGTKFKMIDVKKYRLDNLTDRPRAQYNGKEYYLINHGKIS